MCNVQANQNNTNICFTIGAYFYYYMKTKYCLSEIDSGFFGLVSLGILINTSKKDRTLTEFLTGVVSTEIGFSPSCRNNLWRRRKTLFDFAWKLQESWCSDFFFSLQVTSLLRRVLPEVTPSRLASIIGVKSLPPADISDIIHSTEKGDWNKLGILDMFLGCIAKALTVQLKAKGTTITGTAGTTAGKGVTTVTLPMIFNSRFVEKKYIYI